MRPPSRSAARRVLSRDGWRGAGSDSGGSSSAVVCPCPSPWPRLRRGAGRQSGRRRGHRPRGGRLPNDRRGRPGGSDIAARNAGRMETGCRAGRRSLYHLRRYGRSAGLCRAGRPTGSPTRRGGPPRRPAAGQARRRRLRRPASGRGRGPARRQSAVRAGGTALGGLLPGWDEARVERRLQTSRSGTAPQAGNWSSGQTIKPGQPRSDGGRTGPASRSRCWWTGRTSCRLSPTRKRTSRPHLLLRWPPYRGTCVNPGPLGGRPLALSADAKWVAVVRDPETERFTIDLLPATPGRLLTELKPERTLGPFAGPCRDVQYTAGGRLVFLSGSLEEQGDWTVALVDPDKNEIARTTRIPAPGFCYWRYMLSLSADARLAAIAPRLEARHERPRRHDPRLGPGDGEGTAGRFLSTRQGYGTGHAFTPDGKRLVASTRSAFLPGLGRGDRQGDGRQGAGAGRHVRRPGLCGRCAGGGGQPRRQAVRHRPGGTVGWTFGIPKPESPWSRSPRTASKSPSRPFPRTAGLRRRSGMTSRSGCGSWRPGNRCS